MAVFWTVFVASLFLVSFLPVWKNIVAALWGIYRRQKAVKNIPGWPTHWLWGNGHQFVKGDELTIAKWQSFVQDNGHRITKKQLGPFHPTVQVAHCKLVPKVVKTAKDDQIYNALKPWIGEGLIVSQGKKWFRNRRLLTSAFHFEILKGYIPIYNGCLDTLFHTWSTDTGGPKMVVVFRNISKLSLDVILQCACSYKSGCQTASEMQPYISAVYNLVRNAYERFYSPIYLCMNDWIYYQCTTHGRKYKEACRVAHEFSERVIQERKMALNLGGTEANIDAALDKAREQRKYLDFLDILLTATDEDGKGLTDLEIRDEVDTFMFAGHDTTTSGMSWSLYCLAKHPEHQEKVREEVRNVLMGREWLEYEDLKDLKYTTWCIKEAMRLYPPAAGFTRILNEDTELDGHILPKGMPVDVSVECIHRQPDTWENPNEYDPLRFHPSNVEGRDPYAYMPFSAGYRNCIGQNFALNEAKVVVATIINRYQLNLDEQYEVERKSGVILHAKDGIKLKIYALE